MRQKSGHIHGAGMVKEVIVEPVERTINGLIDLSCCAKYLNSYYPNSMASARAAIVSCPKRAMDRFIKKK